MNEINELKELIKNAKHIAFFGGAGVSTESGIPDFRGKDGLYNKPDINFSQYKPEYLLSCDCLNHNPKVFYEFYRQKMNCLDVEPNITHKLLAKWEQSGKRVSVITQNIDGLHEKAGSEEIYNIHGTIMRNYCVKCGKEYPADYIFKYSGAIPRCTEHKAISMVRPDVTLYGERLPEAYEKARKALHEADLLIVAGTSLTVYPAAYLLQDFYGKHMVIINRDPVSHDVEADADIVIHSSLGDVFSQLEDI